MSTYGPSVQADVHRLWPDIEDALTRARLWCTDPAAPFNPPVSVAEQSLGGTWQDALRSDGINPPRLAVWLADCDAPAIVAVPPKKGRCP